MDRADHGWSRPPALNPFSFKTTYRILVTIPVPKSSGSSESLLKGGKVTGMVISGLVLRYQPTNKEFIPFVSGKTNLFQIE